MWKAHRGKQRQGRNLSGLLTMLSWHEHLGGEA